MSFRDDGAKGTALPPGQRAIRELLRWGKDHPAIIPSIPKIDLKTWVLKVDGEVERPIKLTWDEFTKLPRTKSVSDFHCVEGWSVLGLRWEGVRFRDVADLVGPKETAKHVLFECSDDYTTSLSLNDLMGDDVLLAYKLNERELESGLGFPLRLIVPAKYAYKSAMWITGVKFMSRKELGYWETRGYSDTADVWKDDRFAR